MALLTRRIFLVDPSLQIRFGLSLGIAGGVAVVACAGVLHELTLVGRETLPVSRAVANELLRQDVDLFWAAFWVALLIGGVWSVAGTFLSHRLAGPVFALSRYAAALAKGKFPVPRPLREGDELKDFFDVFSKSIDALRAQEVEDLRKLNEVIQQMEHVPPSDDVKSWRVTLSEMARRKRAATESDDAKQGAR